MNTGISADVGTVFNLDVSRERRSVGHDHAVADQAVVRDVGLGHDQTIVTGFRKHSTASRAAMNGDKLANLVPFADARFGRFAFVLQILGGESDRDEWKNLCAGAD